MPAVPVALDLYTVVVSFHVIFALVGLGSAFAFPFIGMQAKANPQHTAFALKVNLIMITKWISPMAVLVLLTGIYQAIDGPYSF